jgi:hypothetical protein
MLAWDLHTADRTTYGSMATSASYGSHVSSEVELLSDLLLFPWF